MVKCLIDFFLWEHHLNYETKQDTESLLHIYTSSEIFQVIREIKSKPKYVPKPSDRHGGEFVKKNSRQYN